MPARSARLGTVLLRAAAAAAGLASVAWAGISLAQSPLPITVVVHPRVTPNRAGTPKHPQGVKLDVQIQINMPAGYDPPLVQSIDVWFPKGGLYNGAKYPKCSEQTLSNVGLAGCPKGSIMGHGTGVARADTVLTDPQITVVNGGRNFVYFYTILNNPARVQAPVVATVTRLSGKWSYQLHAVIPKSLQIVAGVPIVLQSLHIVAGRGDWIATTYCPPNHQWPYQGQALFDSGQTVFTSGTVGCR